MSKNSGWDKIVLTTGTAEQKNLCLRLIDSIMPRMSEKISVVSDDELGGRIGSGGAVLNVLKKYAQSCPKLLIINSGGFSKRCINYAVKGKAFAGIVYNGKEMTLLELLISNADKLSDSVGSGALILCGDIPVDADPKTDFTDSVGFCTQADIETGTRHGVMYKDVSNRLTHYLHKRSREKLEAMGQKKILADTGTVFFSSQLITKLLAADEKHGILNTIEKNNIEFNLYPEIVSLLSENIDREVYLNEDAQNNAHIEIRKSLLDNISDCGLNVEIIEESGFLHFGTLKESAENIIRFADTENVVINSFTDSPVTGNGTVIENSFLEGDCQIGSGCLISDILLKNITVHDNTAVCGIKIKDGSFVAVICNIYENPKESDLWNKKRFYRGKTFTDSYLKYFEKSSEPELSLADCTENADFSYPAEWINTLKSLNYCRPNEEYAKKRNEVLNEYFKNLSPVEEIVCRRDSAQLSLPVRVNFSGTWTDAMPYCTDNGGQVVNAAVKVDGKLPIQVSAEKLNDKKIEFVSDGKVQQINLNEIDNDRYENDFDHFILHRAVLKVMGISNKTKLTDGFRLTTKVSSIANGSGLGTSSILLAGCFSVLSQLFRLPEESKIDIISKVFTAELVMKTGGGWQDQAGGLFPSVKVTTSNKGFVQKTEVKSVEISEEFEKILNKRLIAVSTGQRHFGRFVVSDVMNGYLNGKAESLDALNALKALNTEAVRAFESSDLSLLSQCLNRQWELLKRLSDYITNSEIDRITDECRKIADGVCICGAGAGGYLLLILKENVGDKELKEFAQSFIFKNNTDAVKRLTIYR